MPLSSCGHCLDVYLSVINRLPRQRLCCLKLNRDQSVPNKLAACDWVLDGVDLLPCTLAPWAAQREPSDTNQPPSFMCLSWCHNSVWVLHLCQHALTVSRRRTCEPRLLWAVSSSSIVFHPHCAERDVSSKCPHVSLMALPPLLLLPVCGAVTGHTRH